MKKSRLKLFWLHNSNPLYSITNPFQNKLTYLDFIKSISKFNKQHLSGNKFKNQEFQMPLIFHKHFVRIPLLLWHFFTRLHKILNFLLIINFFLLSNYKFIFSSRPNEAAGNIFSKNISTYIVCQSSLNEKKVESARRTQSQASIKYRRY